VENVGVVVPYEGRDRFSESERYRDKDIQDWGIVVANRTRSRCDDELNELSPSLVGNERNPTHCYWLRLHSLDRRMRSGCPSCVWIVCVRCGRRNEVVSWAEIESIEFVEGRYEGC
jgi:hypothetical protein